MAQSFSQKLKQNLIEFLARRLPACDVVTKLFSASLDRPTTIRERVTMRLHLLTCEACRRYLAQIQQMREFFQPHESVDSEKQNEISADARERIRAAIKTANQKPK